MFQFILSHVFCQWLFTKDNQQIYSIIRTLTGCSPALFRQHAPTHKFIMIEVTHWPTSIGDHWCHSHDLMHGWSYAYTNTHTRITHSIEQTTELIFLIHALGAALWCVHHPSMLSPGDPKSARLIFCLFFFFFPLSHLVNRLRLFSLATVGDIFLLLSSSSPSPAPFLSQTYYAIPDTMAFRTEQEVDSLHATIECEQPQPDLYKWVGRMLTDVSLYANLLQDTSSSLCGSCFDIALTSLQICGTYQYLQGERRACGEVCVHCVSVFQGFNANGLQLFSL